jgi:DNA-binding CsgD family transcriptional regulator
MRSEPGLEEVAIVADAVERGSGGRLLEREAELAVLEAMLAAARGGDGRFVVVEGGTGIGKTRLLAEARALAREAELEVLTARGGELEGDFAFGIVRQLFEAPLAAAPPEVRSELFSGAAELSASLFASAPRCRTREGAESSFAMLHGLYWLAANFASRRPTLLTVDDLHWADEPSLRWLLYLARRLEGVPLLLLLGTRPPEQATATGLVSELFADPTAVTIRLRELGPESVASLARERLSAEPDPAFADALQKASGGNPLYLAAVLDALRQDGTVPIAEHAHRVLELSPQAIARGLASRLSRLPADAVELIRAAAIVGERADMALAAAVAGLETSAALAAAAALVRADLLRHETPLEFTHPIVRSAVLEGMTAAQRNGAHRRAAEALLDRGAPPEQAAAHVIRTIPNSDAFAVTTLRLAAESAIASGSPEAAVAYLRRALEEPPAQQDRLDVLLRLGVTELSTCVLSGSEHLRQAFEELDDIAQRPDVSFAYARSLIMLGTQERKALDLLQQISDVIRERDPALHWRLEALVIIAAQYDPTRHRLAAERLARVRLAEPESGLRSGALLAACASEETREGVSLARAVSYAERALASGALERGEEIFALHALLALTLAGKTEEATRAYAAAIADMRKRGNLFNLSALHLFRGLLRLHCGELLAAEEDIRWSENPAVGLSPAFIAYSRAFLAEVLLERGELDAVRDLIDLPLPDLEEGHRINLLYASGRLRLESGEPKRALADFRAIESIAAPIGIRNPAWVPWRSQAAIALNRLGRIDEARELAHGELELSRAWGAPRAIGISLRALGLLEDGEAGRELLRKAIDVLSGSPARLEHARTLVDFGAALRRANSRSEARKPLREGIELAQGYGAIPLVERANAELAATGAHPRTILLSGLDALTASERRVANMAAEDLSNKEIAQALFVTVKTVEQHLGRVYRKLDISSRRQLAPALIRPAEGPVPEAGTPAPSG